jgi:hypothetical protein
MRDNWIIFAAIIFFIIRLFSSAAKKQAELAKKSGTDKLQKAIADQARHNRTRERTDTVRMASEVLLEQQVERDAARESQSDTEDFELAYASTEYRDAKNTGGPKGALNDRPGSSSRGAGGTYKETDEEREVYDAPTTIPRTAIPATTTGSYRQYIISKEIFDKPKSMR